MDGSSASVRDRFLRWSGLHPMVHRPPLVWRFWVYSATAYLLPVVIQLGFPAEGTSLDDLIWLVTLVPAFLLSLHYGLRGAFVALILGTVLLLGVQFALVMTATPGDLRITVPIYIAYGALSISVGWLSEELHEHYEYALDLQAQQKSEALETMAAGMAHDFNNILTSMVANAELMADAIPEGRDAGKRELRQLKAASRRGAGMVRNLLGFSQRGMLSLNPVPLPALVQKRLPRIERMLDESIRVEFTAEEDLPAIRADEGAVERVLMNLVSNARDAMPAGGRLNISVHRGHLDQAHLRQTGWGDPGEYVCLSVADTGMGMDDHALSQVFEPFFSLKDAGEGAGLGMSLVYGLMKQHRGFIDVQSRLGEGTLARAYFPITTQPVPAEEGDQEPVPAQGSETILLVEDDAAIREAASRILERFGYTVHQAADGQEALDFHQARGGEVDLILADVVLPRLSGPDFYQAIRTGPFEPPVLFMSGYPARTVQAETELDPSLPFLQKPWSVEELVRAVRAALDEAASVKAGSVDS